MRGKRFWATRILTPQHLVRGHRRRRGTSGRHRRDQAECRCDHRQAERDPGRTGRLRQRSLRPRSHTPLEGVGSAVRYLRFSAPAILASELRRVDSRRADADTGRPRINSRNPPLSVAFFSATSRPHTPPAQLPGLRVRAPGLHLHRTRARKHRRLPDQSTR